MQLFSFSVCGTQITCAYYFSASHYQTSYTVVSSWNFTVALGYNKIILSQPIFVKKGFIFYVAQNLDSGKIALDISGNSLYCDIAWKPYLEKISPQINYRFFLTPLTNFSLYFNEIVLYHTYQKYGIYNVTLNFLSSNQKFQSVMNITNCKCLLLILNLI